MSKLIKVSEAGAGHMHYVYDEDGDLSTYLDQKVIRGGSDGNGYLTITIVDYIYSPQETILNNDYDQVYWTDVPLNGITAEDAFQTILSWQESFGTVVLTPLTGGEAEGEIAVVNTGLTFDVDGETAPNSTSVIATLDSIFGNQFNLLIPELGGTGPDYSGANGWERLVSGGGSDTLIGSAGLVDNTFHDINGGDDVFYGGDDDNDVRHDVTDGVDTVYYADAAGTGTLEVYDDSRVMLDESGAGGFTDTLYSIEKVRFGNYANDNHDFNDMRKAA